MKNYLIVFEPEYDSYSSSLLLLSERVKQSGQWARIAKSTWLLKSFLNKNELMNLFRPVLGQNDRLLIMEVKNEWISFNFSNEVQEWMKRAL